MYDPDITSTGHQPNGFDQLMAFFQHYTVIDSTMRVSFAPTSGSNITPMLWDILLSEAPTITIAQSSDLLESREGTGMAIIAGTERGYIGQPKTLKRNFNAKKFFSKSNIVGDTIYRGNASSNPAEQAYFIVVATDIAGNDPGQLFFNVVIDYLAVLTEPKPQLAS